MKNTIEAKPYGATCTIGPCSVLGPYPAMAVAALADLGLSDQEIAGYFGIRPERITRLRLKTAPELRPATVDDLALSPELDRQ